MRHRLMKMLMQKEGLVGRKAIVSGAASGIGASIAEQLSLCGCQVVGVDVLPNQNSALLPFQADLTRREEVQALWEFSLTNLGKPDLLVACAGIGIHEQLNQGDPDKWTRVIEANLSGTLRFIRAFLPGMLELGYGDIVLISSVAARTPYENGGAYAASKAGLSMAAECLRLETCGKVRVTTISPGLVNTNMITRELSGSRVKEFEGMPALEAADVADTVLFAITRSPEVAINEIVLRPQGQRF